jgi:mRNA interferase MazF
VAGLVPAIHVIPLQHAEISESYKSSQFGFIQEDCRLMAIAEHPRPGVVVMCDYNSGFRAPEMVKRRPVVIISPRIRARPGLCTIVALSTTAPTPIMPYHCQIDLRPRLPEPFQSDGIWVKGDMINTVAFHRLDLVRLGRDGTGKRKYLLEPLSDDTLRRIRNCVLKAMGLG